MKKSTRTTPQWLAYPRSLLESPVLGALNNNERKVMDRIMLEHQRKSGFQNNGLIVTTRQFVKEAWVQPRHVSPSLAVLRTLGIIECVRSWGVSKGGRTPNLYKLPWLPGTPRDNDASYPYEAIKTREDAVRIAELHDQKWGAHLEIIADPPQVI